MHTVALQLAPILAAEKSKVPFYVAGGLLVTWALLLSLAIGMRRPDFPRNPSEQRAVIAITGVLVAVAVAMAVVTSGSPAKSVAATAAPGPSSSSPAASAGGNSLNLAADPGGALAYNTRKLSAKAGTVTITMANGSPVEHNVAIARGSKVLGSTPSFAGGSKTLTLRLKPGRYTFFCTIPGHRTAGMEGTLSVS